jgi:hypothetical protein
MTVDKPDELTMGQIERLAILNEECAEVSQIIGKILRFGYESRFPADGKSNKERLQEELRDVLVAALLLLENDDINPRSLDWGSQFDKRVKMTPWTNYQTHSPKDVKLEFWLKNLSTSK